MWNVYRAKVSMIPVFNRCNPQWLSTGLLTGFNTMKRHFFIMGLSESPLRRRCGAQKETSPHALGTCEALVTFRHHYLGSFSFDPEDVRNLALEWSWVFIKGQNSHVLDFSSKGHKVPVETPKFIGTQQGSYTLTHSLLWSDSPKRRWLPINTALRSKRRKTLFTQTRKLEITKSHLFIYLFIYLIL